MKKRILCYGLLVFLLFSTSCQKKVAQNPIIKISSKASVEQVQKSEWHNSSYDSTEPDFRIVKSKIVNNPYKEIWDYSDEYKKYLGRFYKDIDGDYIPELFIHWDDIHNDSSYLIYKISSDQYHYLGSITFWSWEILQTKHSGYKDILIFSSKGKAENNEELGYITLLEFNGKSYVPQKSMDITLQQSVDQNLYHPLTLLEVDLHPNGNKLLWSPKDDDNYRKMLVTLTQITFDVRFELGYGDISKEKALIQESGVVITLDWDDFILGKATQEQYDFLKQKQVPIYRKWEWIPVEKEKDKKPTRYFNKFVANAYQDIDQLLEAYNKENDCRVWYLKGRSYRDFNLDSVPELLISTTGGTGGLSYVIYQITKEGYQRLGGIAFKSIQLLPTNHNGFCDLMTYWHWSYSKGELAVYEYNGKEYVKVKKMTVSYKDMIEEKIFTPEEGSKQEEYDIKLSPKDDDKYRSMIK
jgi:hypothetical protein